MKLAEKNDEAKRTEKKRDREQNGEKKEQNGRFVEGTWLIRGKKLAGTRVDGEFGETGRNRFQKRNKMARG